MYARFSTGSKSLDIDPSILSDKATRAGKGRKVCLVSDTAADAPPTAQQIAMILSEDNWSVTLLDLTIFKSPKYSPHRNEHVHQIPNSAAQVSSVKKTYDYVRLKGHYGENNWYTPMQAFCAYQWLKDKDFDLIIFHQGFGAGYFCCVARSMGLAFPSTPLLILGDDPHAHWLEDAKWIPDAIRTEAEIDFLERESIRRADGAFFTTRDALDWMVAAEWQLPANLAVMDGDKDRGQPLGKWLSKQIDSVVPSASPDEDIFISVCMTTYNRPDMLRAAINSLVAQTYKKFELIVVDDGSTNKSVESLRKELAPLFAKRKWTWVKQANAGPSAGRMHAVKLAKADYFLFMDDDNTALADELELFARAASCGADIITCVYGLDPRSDPPGPLGRFPARPAHKQDTLPLYWIPYGANLVVNVFFNTLGDTNALFKRKVFEELGGFDGDKTVLMEDWTFLTRAAIAGYRIEVMPEIVMLHWRHKGSRDLYGATITESLVDSLKPYMQIVPQSMMPLLLGLRARVNNWRLKYPGRYRSSTSTTHYKARAVHPAFQVKPAKEQRVQVAICTDDNFAIPASVTLMSLYLSTKRPIDVYVISAMSEEKIAVLKAVAAHFDQKIHVVPFTEKKELPIAKLGQYRSQLTFARLYLPECLPQLKKVIYLDCDLIVRRDISELWNFNLGDNLLGAVSDPGYAPGYSLEEGFQDRYGGDYFNAGVMLINLEAWRKENVTKKTIMQVAAFEKAKAHYWWDQCSLNKVMAGRWSALPLTWNFTEKARTEMAPFYRLTIPEFEEVRDDPRIFHFITHNKPWHSGQKTRTGFAREYQIYEKMVKELFKS